VKTGRKKLNLSKDAALDAVPVPNQFCRVETTDTGRVQVSAPVRRTLLSRLMKRLTDSPQYKKIELDEIGTFVWQQCDGRTNVRKMIDRLCKRYKLSYREGEVSLTQYLSTLARRNLIGLAVRGDGPSGRGGKRTG